MPGNDQVAESSFIEWFVESALVANRNSADLRCILKIGAWRW